jgi:hypothetical protein
MIKRPVEIGAFEFAVLCGLRAAQLSRGCLARVESSSLKFTTVAQIEVSEFRVVREAAASQGDITVSERP